MVSGDGALAAGQLDEQWLPRILGAMRDAVVVTDDLGQIRYVNAAFTTMFGYELEEVMGREALPVSAPADDQGRAPCAEQECRHRDGSAIWVSATTTPLDVPSEDRAWRVHVLRDITERRRAHVEDRQRHTRLLHSRKLDSLAALAEGVAHDLNNLLTVILGNADLVLDQAATDSPVAEGVREMESAAQRASELSGKLLTYSGRAGFSGEPVDLSRLVLQARPALRASVARQIEMVWEVGEDLPAVQGDPSQLRQVLGCLVNNASEALGARAGTITVRTKVRAVDKARLARTYLADELPEGSYVYLEVIDTGGGMDEKARARLFDPFFTTKRGGRGLGLATVLGVVRAHKGGVEVDSRAGEGATFRVLLPVAATVGEVDESEPTRAAAGAGGAGGTVLVVDDEDAVRSVARRLLVRRGFRVLGARDGRGALEVFRRHADEIVAVLLDVTMPNMGGVEAMGELRKIRPDVVVVLCSGYEERDVTGELADPPAGFLHKPYQSEALMAKLAEVL